MQYNPVIRLVSGLACTMALLSSSAQDMRSRLVEARERRSNQNEAAVLVNLETVARPRKNFVFNSGFEITGAWGRGPLTKGQTGWLCRDGKTVRVDQKDPRSGEHCLRLVTDGTGASRIEQRVPLQVGQTYTLSAYMKSEGLTTIRPSQSSVAVRIIDSGWHWARAVSPAEPTTEWQRHSVTFTCPEKHETRSQQMFTLLVYLPKDEEGTLWVDDIQIEAGREATPHTTNSVQEFLSLAKEVNRVSARLHSMPDAMALLSPNTEALTALENELIEMDADLRKAADDLKRFTTLEPAAWEQAVAATRRAAERSHELTYLTWWTNPWKRYTTHQAPVALTAEARTLRLAINDYQPLALMITNVSGAPTTIRVRFMRTAAKESMGRYTGHMIPVPEWAVVRQALMVTPEYEPDSEYPSMLAPLAASQTVSIAPGKTQQVWVDVDSTGLSPGDYSAIIQLQPQSDLPVREIPVTLRVEDVVLPVEVPAEVFCWGANPLGSLGEMAQMPQAEINRLQDPWLQDLVNHGVNRMLLSSTRFTPRFGPDDALAEPIDFTFHDKLLTSMRRYVDDFVGAYSVAHYHMPKTPDERFRKRFGAMMEAWTSHLADLGITPDQMPFEIIDEPSGPEVTVFRTATEVLRDVAPGWKTMAAISQKIPAKLEELIPMMDIMVVFPSLVPEADRVLRESDREVWTYVCSGGLRSLDPYRYFLKLPWHTWRKGYAGYGFFWTMAYMHSPRQNRYSPYYVGTNGPIPSRGWQAFRRGGRDWTYLYTLRSLARKADAKGHADAATKARQAIERAVEAVVDPAADEETATEQRQMLLDALVTINEDE